MGIWNPTILNPETFEIRIFWRYDFKWLGFNYGYSYGPNHSKTRPFKIWMFVTISHRFWQNDSHLSRFRMVGLPGFRSHSKSGPFATQPLFYYSKSRLVRISDPHCNVGLQKNSVCPLYWHFPGWGPYRNAGKKFLVEGGQSCWWHHKKGYPKGSTATKNISSTNWYIITIRFSTSVTAYLYNC